MILPILTLLSVHTTHAALRKNPRRHRETFESSISSDASVEREVCVVGGGPAGVYATKLLEDKGYSTALFEKAGSLGGKTNPAEDDTEIVDGKPTSMFRHVLTSDMTLVNSLISELGLEGYADRTRTNQNLFLADDPYSIFPMGEYTDATNIAVGKYFQKWAAYEAQGNLITKPNHDGIPEELMVPLIEWLSANDLLAIMPAFYVSLTNYGYSFFQEIPTIYVLKYVTPSKITEGSYTWFPMHLIFEELGKKLNEVHLNTEVKRIKQSFDDGSWEIATYVESKKVKAKGKKHKLSYKCEHVVLAYPPTMKGLNMVKRLAPDTRNLFTNIRTVSYWEGVISDLPDCSQESYESCIVGNIFYFKAPTTLDVLAPTYNTPNIYYRHQNDTKAFVLFNAGDQDYEEEEFLDVVRGHLEKAFGYVQDSYKIEAYQKWPYFPHVSTEAMKDGFYSKLKDVQGNQNLYFAGGFADFELVDNSMRSTEELLDQHFPGKNLMQ